MRPGTPGFVGSRLREAREARGLTQGLLAELLGVTAQAVSQYENAKASPHPEVVTKLPVILNVPVAFFLEPAEPEEASPTIFWRSMASATQTARTRADRRFGWYRRLVQYLGGYVQFPGSQVPDWAFPADPLEIENGDIETVARRLREAWQLGNGPIRHLVHLLENQGVMVARMALNAATLDAFSQWRVDERRPYIVLGADKDVAVRSRWDAAHELGHLLFHRAVDADLLRKKDVFNRIEDQAHLFAGAFLLPAETFADDFVVPSLDALFSLKMKWNVSMSGILMRAKRLDLLSESDERRFWRSYSSKGYKGGEPLDDRLPPERPELTRQALTMLLDQGIQTRAQVTDRLVLSNTDIEELAGVTPGYLGDSPKVLVLNPRTAPEPATEPRSPGGETPVLQFPRRSLP